MKNQKPRNSKEISAKEKTWLITKRMTTICSAGKKMLLKGAKSKKFKSGYKSTVHVYECKICSDCECKS